MFGSTQSVPPVNGSCIILIVIGTCISHEESNSNKLNDLYAKLTDGSCPSHHSPSDMIPLSNDNTCLWLGK